MLRELADFEEKIPLLECSEVYEKSVFSRHI